MTNRRLPKGAYKMALALERGKIDFDSSKTKRVFYHTAGRIEFLTDKGLFVMPHEVFDLYEKSGELDQFSSFPQTDNSMTYAEHGVIGSSTSSFFRHPFMGDYRVNKDWQEEMKTKRKQMIKERPTKIGFILWENPKREGNYMPSILEDGIYDGFGVTKMWKRSVEEKLRKLYEMSTTNKNPAPDFDSLDYARIPLIPRVYDRNMVAVPKNGPIELIKDGQRILQIKCLDLEERLNPIFSLDRREIDQFKVEDMSTMNFPGGQFPKKDNRVSVYVAKSNNGVHILSHAPTAYLSFGGDNNLTWQGNYSRQIALS